MIIENLDNIRIAARIQERFDFKLGELSLILGHREMLAREILNKRWEVYKEPEVYKSLLLESYSQANDRIKKLLAID